jgi:hypothetical protein
LESLECTTTSKLPTTRLPESIPLASSFVAYQMWEEPTQPEESLQAGTIFTELNLPFLGDGGASDE